MKKYLYTILTIIILAWASFTYRTFTNCQKYKVSYERELSNVRAYEANSWALKNEIKEYQFTIDEMKNSQDSLNQEMLKVAKQLGIKDKNIQYLQYHKTTAVRIDTIRLKGDTIFKETVNNIDTVVGDEWYNLHLNLNYPSTIIASPTFNSEKYVIINTKKEYNSKPSKFFLIRWFQKKHWVTVVTIKENNPYIEEKEQKFIKIVK